MKHIKKLTNKLLKTPFIQKYIGGDDRGSFRNRRLFYSVISSLGAKGVTVLVSLLSVPLTFNYLNPERFGIMMTIVSLITTINFADLGIGFGLQNRWAELSLDETGISLQKAISSVFFFLLGIGCCLLLVGMSLYFWVDLSFIFNLKGNDPALTKEVNDASLVFFIITALAFPFSIVQKVQAGKQESYITNFWIIASNVSSLLLLLLFTFLKLGIPFIIFALYGVNNLLIVINFFIEFYKKNTELSPQIQFYDFTFLKGLIKDGIFFLSTQLGAMTLNTGNNVILASYHGAATVGYLNIGLKLISLFLIPIEVFAPNLLPAINDALSRNDFAWLHSKLRFFLKFVLVYGLVSFCVLLFTGNYLIEVWLSTKMGLDFNTLLVFSLFLVYSLFLFFISYIMLNAKFIKFTAFIYVIAVIVATILKYIFVDDNIQGILYSQMAAILLFFFIPSFLIVKNNNFI